MLDERDAAAVGFTFREAPAQVQQEQVYGDRMLVGVPPTNNYLGPLGNQSLQSTSSAPASLSKLQCAVHGCNRKSAVECGLCKGCCEGRGTGCPSRTHRKGPPRTKKVSSFVPQQPSPALPAPLSTTSIDLTESSAKATPEAKLNSSGALPPRLFRDEMPAQSFQEWKAREQAVEERRAAAQLRRQNELAMAKQVVIRLWQLVCVSYHLFLYQYLTMLNQTEQI